MVDCLPEASLKMAGERDWKSYDNLPYQYRAEGLVHPDPNMSASLVVTVKEVNTAAPLYHH